jgi:cytochrome c556
MKSIVAVVFTILVCPMVLADGEAEFKYRQGVMQTVGGHMSSLAGILRGQVHVENLGVHAKGMADLATIVPNVFPEGSGVAISEALPEIWENPDDFKAAIDKFVEAANGMSAAANDSDGAAAIGPAMNALGQSCKGCHDNFREEHDD